MQVWALRLPVDCRSTLIPVERPLTGALPPEPGHRPKVCLGRGSALRFTTTLLKIDSILIQHHRISLKFLTTKLPPKYFKKQAFCVFLKLELDKF